MDDESNQVGNTVLDAALVKWRSRLTSLEGQAYVRTSVISEFVRDLETLRDSET